MAAYYTYWASRSFEAAGHGGRAIEGYVRLMGDYGGETDGQGLPWRNVAFLRGLDRAVLELDRESVEQVSALFGPYGEQAFTWGGDNGSRYVSPPGEWVMKLARARLALAEGNVTKAGELLEGLEAVEGNLLFEGKVVSAPAVLKLLAQRLKAGDQ
jgi:hypothetical protein